MEFNFQGIPQQAYLTMLIIFILLHYGKTVSACETEQRDENIQKNAIPVVLGYANNYQDNYFQGQILTFYLLWHIISCLIVVKLLRTLLSSARLKSYPKRRETKRGELKLIEKIRIPLEKSNFIPSNFAEGVVNNDHLQLHPTRKSQCMSFASFIVQDYPYTRCYRAEFHHQGLVVQRLDNAIHWINRSPVDSAVRFLNSYPLHIDLSVG